MSDHHNSYPIPKGFTDVLEAFTKEVLRDQPKDILEYAARYFEALRDGKTLPNKSTNTRPQVTKQIYNSASGASAQQMKFEGSVDSYESSNRMTQLEREIKDRHEFRTRRDLGIRMNAISFGNWFDTHEDADITSIKTLLESVYKLGVRYFDTYETPGGKNLQLLGQVLETLRAPRDSVTISVKIILPSEISEEAIEKLLDECLSSLKMSYVDIVYCIRNEENINIINTCHAMGNLVKKKKAKHWGTCGWPASFVKAVASYCKELDLIPPTVAQGEFSFFSREFERETLSIAGELDIGAVGYLDVSRELVEKARNYTGLRELADGLGMSIEHMLIGFFLNQSVLSCVVIAKSIDEFEYCMRALEIYDKLTLEKQVEIAEALNKVEELEEAVEQGEMFEGGDEGGDEAGDEDMEGEGQVEGEGDGDGEGFGDEGDQGEGEGEDGEEANEDY